MNGGAALAVRHDEGAHAGRHFGAAPAGAREQHLSFVIVDGHVAGQLDELAQVLAAEQRHRLAEVEDERNAGLGELPGVVQHPFAAVRRDDAQPRRALALQGVLHVRQLRLVHRARVEGGDLVVLQIGGDHRLRGEGIGQHADMLRADAERAQVVQIRAGILADRRHHHRLAAEQLQAVGDIAGAAAEFAAHAGDQEGHIEHVDLVRQDVFAEPALERHDGVVGDGAADQAGHGCSKVFGTGGSLVVLLVLLVVCLPSPACGRGAGERAEGGGHATAV